MISRMTGSPALSVTAILAFVVGLALLALAVWAQPLTQAVEAAGAGEAELALERYAAIEARFAAVPIARQVWPSAYQAAVANQLRLRYSLGRFDEIIEKAAMSPSTPAIHFWAGCALFEKARVETKRDERVTWLNRATDEFRKTLDREPDDWDAKFNYELTRKLLGELREEKTADPNKLLPLLRPQPRSNTTRRVG